MDKRKKIIISFFIVLMLFPFYVTISKSALSDEAQLCLGCHSDKNLTKELMNKEILSLYINGDDFSKSTHSQMGCKGCHMDISMDTHPQTVKKITSKKEYSATQSKICTMCHAVEQVKKEDFHSIMVKKVRSVACSECHGAHYIRKIKDWKKGLREDKYCLTCHRYEFSKILSSGEILNLYVNESVLKNSVHGSLGCSGCHQGFSIDKHPLRTIKSRQDFVNEISKACNICHKEQIRKNAAHAALVAKDTCVGCHGSHNIQFLTAQKEKVGESEYCLTCHRTKLTMSMRNGEKLSVYVDTSTLKNSVHGNLKCTDCHTNFSKTQHPIRSFESIKEYLLISSELCKKCHAETFSKYETSIHYSLVKNRNFNAPTCIGCHGLAHSIAKATADKTLGLTLCNKCHSDMYSSYAASIHEKARIKGIENTPTCSSCHNAHDVQIASITPKVKESCMVCHKEAIPLHSKWLYNPPIRTQTFAGLHLDSVTCAACHSPNSKRGIYLLLIDSKTGNPLSQEEIMTLLETDSHGLKEKIDPNSDGVIDAVELWGICRQLHNKGIKVTFKGRMNVQTGEEAHMLAEKTQAVRECVLCHRPDSEFFKNIFVVISKADEKPMTFNAKQEIIGSIYSIWPMRKFYALGSSNVRLLDYLFIIALIGGIAVPIGHITLRIVTSPLRSLRRMGKGGKK